MRQPSSRWHGGLPPLVAVLTLGLALLVAAEVTVSEDEPFLLQVGEQTLTLAADTISGAGIELRHIGQHLRGTLHGRPVELEWNEARIITGQVSDEPVQLAARQRPSDPRLDVSGSLGGEPVELILAPTGIFGKVGRCDYALPMAGDRYVGWRTCDVARGPPVSVVLRLPEALVPLTKPEQAALLVLLLSAEAIPPAPLPEETPGQSGPGAPSP